MHLDPRKAWRITDGGRPRTAVAACLLFFVCGMWVGQWALSGELRRSQEREASLSIRCESLQKEVALYRDAKGMQQLVEEAAHGKTPRRRAMR